MTRIVDIKVFLQDNTILPCNSEVPGFTDKDHRHIVTGKEKLIIFHEKKLSLPSMRGSMIVLMRCLCIISNLVKSEPWSPIKHV